MPYLLDMCPAELKKAKEENMPLIIAAGSIEFHGGQLPLGTDLFITEGVSAEIEKRLPVVIAPSFVYCPTGHCVSGPEDGTVDIDIDCFVNFCGQVLKNYDRMGFKKIYIMVHHQGRNIEAFIKTSILKYSMYEINKTLGDGWWTKKLENPLKTAVETVPAVLDTEFFPGHGGQGETEAIMAFRPKAVKMENAETDKSVWWNETAKEADAENAQRQKEILITKWVEKIKKDTGIETV